MIVMLSPDTLGTQTHTHTCMAHSHYTLTLHTHTHTHIHTHTHTHTHRWKNEDRVHVGRPETRQARQVQVRQVCGPPALVRAHTHVHTRTLHIYCSYTFIALVHA
jgi:hypothetical protein